MVIESLSDFYKYSLYIFDLDNTIFNEDDYLFEAYKNISGWLAKKIPSLNEEKLYDELIRIYDAEGRTGLFNKFLAPFDPDLHYLSDCLRILRTFKPGRKYDILPGMEIILKELVRRKKHISILNNGNIEQQKNKIENIRWEDLDRSICFVFANEFEPKPSSAGYDYIKNKLGITDIKAVMTGDSEDDRICASNSGIDFIYVNRLWVLR